MYVVGSRCEDSSIHTYCVYYICSDGYMGKVQ